MFLSSPSSSQILLTSLPTQFSLSKKKKTLKHPPIPAKPLNQKSKQPKKPIKIFFKCGNKSKITPSPLQSPWSLFCVGHHSWGGVWLIWAVRLPWRKLISLYQWVSVLLLVTPHQSSSQCWDPSDLNLWGLCVPSSVNSYVHQSYWI